MWRRLLRLLLVVVGLLVVWIAGGSVFARHRVRATRRAWAETLGSIDDYSQRHPKTSASPTLHELLAEAARLGIDATSGLRTTDRPAVAPADAKAFAGIQSALSSYVERELKKADDSAIDAPPSELAAFLS